MKVGVLHWPTSSVGGINSTLQSYRRVAELRGDEFDVFVAAPQRTKKPGLFPVRERVRGGDSFIMIDGYAPYHENNLDDTLAMLRTYDVLMTSFLCPHPTKDYGTEPKFLALLEGIRKLGKPLIGYVHDAYWDTYREFAELTLPFCCKTLVAQKAYGDPLVKAGYKVQPVYLPFIPLVAEPKAKRDWKRFVWTPQWKNIKGVHKFFRGIPSLVRSGFSVGLYNNGIEYYKLRLTPEWKKTVDRDNFAPEYGRLGLPGGNAKVEFHGCVPNESIPEVLAGAAFMGDFQGHSAKHAAYLNGSYNTTIIEALYYGAVPVVHSNMLKSTIPNELLLAVDRIEDYPSAVASYEPKKYPRKKAREYVLDNHSAERLYDRIFDKEVRRAIRRH